MATATSRCWNCLPNLADAYNGYVDFVARNTFKSIVCFKTDQVQGTAKKTALVFAAIVLSCTVIPLAALFTVAAISTAFNALATFLGGKARPVQVPLPKPAEKQPPEETPKPPVAESTVVDTTVGETAIALGQTTVEIEVTQATTDGAQPPASPIQQAPMTADVPSTPGIDTSHLPNPEEVIHAREENSPARVPGREATPEGALSNLPEGETTPPPAEQPIGDTTDISILLAYQGTA